MAKQAYYIINGITLYRIITAPVLVYLAFSGQFTVFRWMLAVSFFTDAIDGVLSRRYHVTSILGAKLDSIGDDLTVLVGIIGAFVYRPDFIEEHSAWFFILLGLFLIQVSLALYRYKKITTFHTYAAKIAAVCQGVFLILFFFLPEPSLFLFYIAVTVTAVDLIEEIVLVLILPKWKANVKGLFWVRRGRRVE